jgi:hypothetical protein
MGKDMIRKDDFLPPGFIANAVSLRVGHEVTFDDITRGCQVLSRLQNVAVECLPYWIGDLMIAAEGKFPDRYHQACEFTDYAVETIRNYVWMCKKVPPENRGIMSIPHTMVVAAQPVEKQKELLHRAKVESLSPTELRRLVRGEENYKARLLPGDVASKRDRLIAIFPRVWDENWHEWNTLPPKEMGQKLWEKCVDLAYFSK